MSFDWTVLVLGAVGFALALGIVTLLTAIRQAPYRRQALATRLGVPRRSSLVGAVSATGMPVPAVTGMRLALEAGEGRTAVPVRAALGGAVGRWWPWWRRWSSVRACGRSSTSRACTGGTGT